MLKSYCEELGEIFNTIDGLPDNPKDYTWSCPICKSKVVHVNESYDDRMEHFRHYIETDCYNEPETKEHIKMKNYFYKTVSLINNPVKKELECVVGDQKIDVFLELETGEKIAIECQYSPIVVNKLLLRTYKYNHKGFYVLWVLGAGKTYLKFDGYEFYEGNDGYDEDYNNIVRITAVENLLHKMYRGRIFYFREIYGDCGIYPTHFKPYLRWIDNEWTGSRYKKAYKTKRIMEFYSLSSLKLICNDHEDFKLAAFRVTK